MLGKGLHEECGVFGVWEHAEAKELCYFGLFSLQHRGQEGAGILTADEKEIYCHRGLGLLTQVFSKKEALESLKGRKAIGHVRYATEGSNSIRNIQPFPFEFYDGNVGLCHNGNLVNAKSLRRSLEKEGAIFHSTSDSEVLIHLLRRSRKETFLEKLKEALGEIQGGFSYLVLTNEALYGAVDPFALRPLVLGRTKQGAYLLASESAAIDAVGGDCLENIGAGEVIVINDEGYRIEKYCESPRRAIAAMEYIYFARPDSNIWGKNVHRVRKESGRVLAREAPALGADIVIGVPNSSLSAASGYAEEAGLPYEMGLIKNQYIARTFIQPTQALREEGVRMKLAPVKGVVEGKSVVLVDDSIVRGTTSTRIVKMLKEAGAREVHLRIASPPFLFPCFYGLDVSRTAELMAANLSLSEMRESIGADTLAFLSVEGLEESIGPVGLCLDSFTADYCAGLGDYKEEFLEALTEIQKDYLDKNGIEVS